MNVSSGYSLDSVLAEPTHSVYPSDKKPDISTFLAADVEIETPFLVPEARVDKRRVDDPAPAWTVPNIGSATKQAERINKSDVTTVGASVTADYSQEQIEEIISANPDFVIIEGNPLREDTICKIEQVSELCNIPLVATGTTTVPSCQTVLEAGADAIVTGRPLERGGTQCESGVGVPSLTAIDNAQFAAKKYGTKDTRIIAGSGITRPANCIKALAAGADAISLREPLLSQNPSTSHSMSGNAEEVLALYQASLLSDMKAAGASMISHLHVPRISLVSKHGSA